MWCRTITCGFNFFFGFLGSYFVDSRWITVSSSLLKVSIEVQKWDGLNRVVRRQMRFGRQSERNYSCFVRNIMLSELFKQSVSHLNSGKCQTNCEAHFVQPVLLHPPHWYRLYQHLRVRLSVTDSSTRLGSNHQFLQVGNPWKNASQQLQDRLRHFFPSPLHTCL